MPKNARKTGYIRFKGIEYDQLIDGKKSSSRNKDEVAAEDSYFERKRRGK